MRLGFALESTYDIVMTIRKEFGDGIRQRVSNRRNSHLFIDLGIPADRTSIAAFIMVISALLLGAIAFCAGGMVGWHAARAMKEVEGKVAAEAYTAPVSDPPTSSTSEEKKSRLSTAWSSFKGFALPLFNSVCAFLRNMHFVAEGVAAVSTTAPVQNLAESIKSGPLLNAAMQLKPLCVFLHSPYFWAIVIVLAVIWGAKLLDKHLPIAAEAKHAFEDVKDLIDAATSFVTLFFRPIRI